MLPRRLLMDRSRRKGCMNVLLLRPVPPGAIQTLRERVAQVEIRASPDTRSLEAALDWAEVIFGNPPAALLRNRANLRWVQIVSAGFDEYASLAGSGVMLTTAHGVHSLAIAQQLMMAMLMFARGQIHFGACQRRRQWDRNPAVPFSLRGQVVGLLGYGSIAREFARMGRLLGVRMRAIRRTPGACPDELEALDPVERLDDLLGHSDHLIVTLPYTKETRGLIDARRVAEIKRGAFFYNVARGGLVDEPALIARLQEGSLGGAAMDVFEREPLPPDSAWWDAPNTLVFPHIAGHHRDLNTETFALFAGNLVRYAARQPLRNEANFQLGY